MFQLSPDEWTAIWLSLRIAIVATVASLPLGIFTAYALARWNFPGKTLVNGFVHLPLVLPPVVTGFILLILLGRQGVFGPFLASIGIVLSFRWTARRGRLRGDGVSVDGARHAVIVRRDRPAPRTRFGQPCASGLWTFILVSLPLAVPGIIVGAILAFAKALGEFGATITFVSNIPGETQTISAAIYTLIQVPGGDVGAMRLTIIAIAIALIALIASEIIQRWAEKRVASFE